VLVSNKMMMPVMARLVDGIDSAGEREQVLTWMGAICEHLHYSNALLTGRRGEIVLVVGARWDLTNTSRRSARQVLEAGKPVLRDSMPKDPHMRRTWG